jgi:oligopeptide transport system substrate-binding protein
VLITARNGTAAGVIALVLGASTAVVAAPARDSVLHRTSGAEPASLDPTLGSGTSAAPILADLVEGLVTRTPAIRPMPGAAESWTVSDDGLRYRFRLRAGLRWSDGRPLVADDFVWSYRRLLDPAMAAANASLFQILANAREITSGKQPVDSLGVAAPDPRTVEFRLAVPAPYFLQLLANTQAAPVPRHVIETLGRDWTRPGGFVSNGPYVLAGRIPQTSVRLTRNPNYREAKAVRVPEVVWYPTQDLGAAARRFRAGELDTVLNVGADELAWFRANQPAALHQAPIPATYQLVFNVTRPPFDDRRIRRALSLALDRETLTDRVLQTGARPTWSFVSPGTGGYRGLAVTEARRPLADRQREARELLVAAGYGPDRSLEVSLLFDTNEENRKIMVAVAGMWQAIGVRTTLTNVEQQALIRAFRTRDFQVGRTQTFALYYDAYAFLQQYASRSPANWAGWSDAAYDAGLEAANASADPRRRLALLATAEERLLAAQPLIPLFQYQGKVLVAPRVRGWWDGAIGTPPSRYLELAR